MKVRYRYVTYGAGRSAVEQMQQMHQLMHRMLSHATPGVTGAWQPATDVYETADALVVRVELAGVREDDIDMTLFADHLSIAGTRRNTASAPAAYHLAGILYGDFQLVAPVTVDVRRDEVEASYDNGLLTVVLPKATSPQRSAISIAPTVDGTSEPHSL